MADSFFFYDLETSGINARAARIMQFAGQRTDLNLKTIGQPFNRLIKLTPDILPSPDAVLLTGITPQQTLSDGISEAEFLQLLYSEIVKPGTTFVGFNNIRFDDEFMRFLNYRNFYDAYAWQWQNGNSRWDLLDVVRMTRALRPDGITWPFAPDSKPTNRLEFLTSVNKLAHASAHDALSDVNATIDVAKLVKSKQPELFNYLLNLRHKRQAAALVDKNEPFIYTSSHFPSEYLHTTAVIKLSAHPNPDTALVYDLRHDPRLFLKLSVAELTEAWRYSADPKEPRLPVKTLKYNRAPAIAPLGVIKDQATQYRLRLDLKTITHHLSLLKEHQPAFSQKMLKVVEALDKEQAQKQLALVDDQLNVDSRLYEGFISNKDKSVMDKIRLAPPEELSGWVTKFNDRRLKSLLPLYKARNYPGSLTSAEQGSWNNYIKQRLSQGGQSSPLAGYFLRLDELAKTALSPSQQFLVEELKLYGQSLLPWDELGSEA